jgi:predicted aspartyl protease
LTTVSFDPWEPSIRVPVLIGTARTVGTYLFVVDTGATRTAVHTRIVRALKLAPDPRRVAAVTTASGNSTACFFVVPRLKGLGLEQTNFRVLAQEFPATFSADGLLGLDFFRGRVLTIDFQLNTLRLRPPRPWWHFWP